MVVQGGPFSGLKLRDEQTWGGGEDIGPQLLGIYEQELHNAIENFVQQSPSTIVNIGCAEGYYAIGLALLLPEARIFAFDPDLRAQRACRENAKLNGVFERVSVEGNCSSARLRELLSENPDALLIADCEGYEKTLFDGPESVAPLRFGNCIIETHDFMDREILPTLVSAFSRSHTLSILHSGARNPHAFSFLDGVSDVDKWLLVCENRPEIQNWLVCERKRLPQKKTRVADITRFGYPSRIDQDYSIRRTTQTIPGDAQTQADRNISQRGYRPYEVRDDGIVHPVFNSLIYTVAYGLDEHFECLRLLLESLAEFGCYAGRIAIFSDRERAQLSDYLPPAISDRITVSRLNDKAQSARYSVPEEHLDGFSPILYLDNDIIVDRDLNALLQEMHLCEGMFVANEKETYGELCATTIGRVQDTRRIGNWFGLELAKSDPTCSDYILPIANSGVFGFCDYGTYKIVGDLVCALYRHPRHVEMAKYFGDQPFLNYVLLKTGLGVHHPLDGKCSFVGEWRSRESSRRGFAHFVWARGKDKPRQMKSYIEHLRAEARLDSELTAERI